MSSAMSYVRLLFAWIVMFAIPVQGFAAATTVFCGPETAHHAHAGGQVHPPGTPAHDRALSEPEKPLWTAGNEEASPLPDVLHECSVCASCCQAVAITRAIVPALTELPTRTDPGEHLLASYGRSSLLPDKPPRA